jgi:hypothetical protein
MWINLLAILPIDSQTNTIPFPSIVPVNVDWADLAIKAFFFIIWGVISIFIMRAVLFGFRWHTAGSDEEYSEWTKSMFIQSTGAVLVLGLLLILVSSLKSIFGIV